MSPDVMDAAALHPLLARQLRRLAAVADSSPATSTWRELLTRVSQTYADGDNDRYTLERSIEISSEETAALYEELSQREQLQRAILEQAAEGILTTDGNGIVQFFNASAERIFGWSSEEVLGQSITMLVALAESGDGLQPLRWFTRAEHSPDSTFYLEALHRDGSTFPLQVSVNEVDGVRGLTHTVICRDVSADKAHVDELHRQARHDPLTGLPNRSLFLERLQATLADSQLHGLPVGVLFIDLDRFKAVNDSLGHDAGDRLLIETAERIRSVLRREDLVARLGGDEFVALCPSLSSVTDLLALARRIHVLLTASFDLNGVEALVSASVGIALSGADDSADALVRRADLAMYRAKSAGRSQTVFFDDAMHQWVDGRLATETALRRGLDRREFLCWYQPIVQLATRQITGVEAFVRWARPGNGLVASSEFVAVAEEAGLIRAIGDFVLNEACDQAKRWAERWPGLHLPVSVNLSASEFHQHNTGSLVQSALKRAGLDPSLLILELTESTLLADPIHSASMLAELVELGVGLTVDDFGTGYSSLAYLRHVPARILKLDLSFIEDVDHDASAASMVRGVTALAHALGLSVIAEGVERESQAETLAELGCDAGQGYLFAAPGAASELDFLIENSLAKALPLAGHPRK